MSTLDESQQYLATLATLLKQTIDPRTRKQAEAELTTAEQQRLDFPIAVLQLVASEGSEQIIRQASALFFKNYIKRNWVPEDDSNKLTDENREWIKENIVNILVGVPNYLQYGLIDSVVIIAKNDFPENWPNLIKQLISKLSTEDFSRNNIILETAHSIFKRLRNQLCVKSVLRAILSITIDVLITQNSANGSLIGILTQTLLFLTKIFYDLNCQDLPPFFEDHIEECMNIFHKYLTYSNPFLESSDENEAGPLEKVKSSICEVVSLYTGKYEDTFTMLPKFVETIWTLLTTTRLEQKYDVLLSRAMGFLTTVVKLERYRNLFENTETLKQFCERIILPNMSLRASDEELFTEDPIEYIRRDLEGSDSDTRRRAATDFVRGLMILYLQQITQIIGSYITHYLQRYKENPALWKEKDTAIYLLTSIAAQGSATKVSNDIRKLVAICDLLTSNIFLPFQHGVTQVNVFVNVVEWFSTNVLPDLQTPVDSEPAVLKVDAIKYLYTFRNQMSKDQLIAVFPSLIKHLSSTNYVVHTYGAIAIERILFMRKDNVMIFGPSDIQEHVQILLVSLFRLIEAGTTPETLAENDYLMKTIMRVIFTSRESIAPLAPEVIGHLSKILGEISKNPSNPRFNHYVFESIGALVRFCCPDKPQALALFENSLFPSFDFILRQDVVEFIPYIFQILSQLLECHTEHDLPQMYRDMLPGILMPNIWNSPGNVPALVRWLQAYLYRGSASIVAENQLVPILGIFQKLLASKANDQYGLELLTTIVEHVPIGHLDQYMQPILTLILRKISSVTGQKNKNEKFIMGFVNFFCYFIALEKEGGGPDYLISATENIQSGLFSQILNNIIISNLQKVQGELPRHICAVAMTHLLTHSNTMLTTEFIEHWPNILTALIKLFEAPVEIDNEVKTEEQFYDFDLEEDREFSAAFAKLATASKPKQDPTGVTNAKFYLAQSVQTLSRTHPGKISDMVEKEIPTECNLYLGQYMAAAGLGIMDHDLRRLLNLQYYRIVKFRQMFHRPFPHGDIFLQKRQSVIDHMQILGAKQVFLTAKWGPNSLYRLIEQGPDNGEDPMRILNIDWYPPGWRERVKKVSLTAQLPPKPNLPVYLTTNTQKIDSTMVNNQPPSFQTTAPNLRSQTMQFPNNLNPSIPPQSAQTRQNLQYQPNTEKRRQKMSQNSQRKNLVDKDPKADCEREKHQLKSLMEKYGSNTKVSEDLDTQATLIRRKIEKLTAHIKSKELQVSPRPQQQQQQTPPQPQVKPVRNPAELSLWQSFFTLLWIPFQILFQLLRVIYRALNWNLILISLLFVELGVIALIWGVRRSSYNSAYSDPYEAVIHGTYGIEQSSLWSTLFWSSMEIIQDFFGECANLIPSIKDKGVITLHKLDGSQAFPLLYDYLLSLRQRLSPTYARRISIGLAGEDMAFASRIILKTELLDYWLV
ncbi:hypothetical protein G9A89_020086 [Geosiphon pyriformis]|nr:hypothetical protein G9A89_020086 [Geosiphon pyriformis]